MLGVVLAASGGRSGTLVMAGGLAAVIALIASGCAALELPVMSAVRYAFVASFFFKSDIVLLKVDEVEDPSGLNLSLSVALAAVLFFYDRVTEGARERTLPMYIVLLCTGLLLAAGASVATSEASHLGTFSLLSLTCSLFMMLAVASHFSRRERLVELVVALAIGVAFTGLTALSQSLLGFPRDLAVLGTGSEEELLGTQAELLGRVPAFLRTPTGLGFVIASLVPIVVTPAICRVKSLTRSQRVLLPLSGLLGIIAVILSLARGSWLALAVGIAVPVAIGWWWVAPNRRLSYFSTTIAAALIGLAVLLPFAPTIYERLTGDDEGSAEIRLPLMENAVRLIGDNPITGVGLNGYRSAMTKYDETGIFVSQVFPNPVHNVFAHVTAEVGIPGGILFCLLILAAMSECVRSFAVGDRLVGTLALGIAVGLVAFCITAMKEPGSLGSARPPIRTLFLMLGAAFAVSRIRRRLMY
jgi:putative inorganic carbon (hco3(-)) transporter